MAIAVDAMGGDNAPGDIVAGAILASSENIKCILVGDETSIRKILDSATVKGLEVVHAPDVVSMKDGPMQGLRKKNSSMAVAVRLVKEGKAKGVFSAGNSGVYVACVRSVLESIQGVDKNGIAINLPTSTGRDILLIDAGAAPDCVANDILGFAWMGKVYAEEIMARENPSIALFNIGEEEFKGNEMTRESFKLLKKSGLNFAGNIEGNAIADGEVDVVVSDGFVGNSILKVAEGTVGYVVGVLKKEFTRDWTGKLGALLLAPAFERIKKRIDWKEWGGGVLLGLKGNVLFGHGRSDARAVYNALRLADNMARSNLWHKIEKEMTPSDQ